MKELESAGFIELTALKP